MVAALAGLIAYPSASLVALTEAGSARARAGADIHSVEDLHQASYAQLGGPLLGSLRTLGLVDYPVPGQVVVTALLFPELPTGSTH
jgi:hypothetical protein